LINKSFPSATNIYNIYTQSDLVVPDFGREQIFELGLLKLAK